MFLKGRDNILNVSQTLAETLRSHSVRAAFYNNITVKMLLFYKLVCETFGTLSLEFAWLCCARRFSPTNLITSQRSGLRSSLRNELVVHAYYSGYQ